MPNLQPVLFIIGVLAAILATFMLLPLLSAGLYGQNEEVGVFTFSLGLTATIGAILIFTQRQMGLPGKITKLNVKQGFLVTSLSWVSLCFLAAVPFYMSPTLNLDFTNAFFEATSGLTTTGATILTNLDNTPRAILLWRSVLQWIGGVGILVTALIALPVLQVGGMQLFRMEFSERMEKTLPRPAQIGVWILGIYCGLTVLCGLLYWMAGMSLFDAINHAMTTVSTGGYSTHNESLGFYQNHAIYIIAITFMILGSLPFLLLFEAVRNHFKKIATDSQVQLFFVMLVLSWIVLYLYLRNQGGEGGGGFAGDFVDVAFNTTSVFTGTGYSTLDYAGWGGFAIMSFFFMMLVGGCSGSTTCGLKIFRVQVLYEAAKNQMLRLTRPNGVFVLTYQGQRLAADVVVSVMGFFFLYVLSFAVLAALLGSTGLDFITAASSAASAIGNVGPGLGSEVGPGGTFTNIPAVAKWLMSMGMLLGRLELYTIFVLFMPSFWRK